MHATRAIERHGTGSLVSVVLAAAALAGCAMEPVTLALREQPSPVAEKIKRPVVFLHSRQMREETQPVQAGVPLRIGEASDRALRAAYTQGFGDMREVSSLEEFRSMSGPDAPAVLLQPEIVGFQAVNTLRRPTGPYVAEIIYRFTLFDRAGAQAGAWEMHSLGSFDAEAARREHSPDFRLDVDSWVTVAPRRAIEAAAAKFLAGFDSVPELMRLRRDLPLAGSNVPAELQQPGGTASTDVMQARYPAAVTLTAAALPSTPAPGTGTQPSGQAAVVSLRVTLRNDGAHRLLVDPATIRWEPAQSATAGFPVLSPIPAAVVPMYLAGTPTTFAPGPMSPGIGMLPNLIAALANAAGQQEHEKAMEARKASVERDLLTEGPIAPGTERTGVVYFSKLRAAYGMLLVPVIDLDDASRYTVRLDMSSSAKP